MDANFFFAILVFYAFKFSKILFDIMKYETAILTEEIREKLGGTFTEVSNGFTHYELKGPESGEPKTHF
jgi:hypothetical protein